MTAQPMPHLDEVMVQIDALGWGTEEYHEAMWMLLSVMARRQAITAERIRAERIRRENRKRRSVPVAPSPDRT